MSDNTAGDREHVVGSSRARRTLRLRFLLLLLILVAAVTVFLLLREHVSLEGLSSQEAEWRDFKASYPWLSHGIAFLVYASITGLSLPLATALTLSYGWFFGLVTGVILVSFASTTGATLAFLSSRYIFRSAFQARFGERLRVFNEALDREGAFYLFSLRLLPPVPFFVINVVMGLSKIKVTTFWWVSQLGMLPGTIVYVYAGSTVPSLTELGERGAQVPWQLFLAFALIGLLPLVLKKTVDRFRPKTSAK